MKLWFTKHIFSNFYYKTIWCQYFELQDNSDSSDSYKSPFKKIPKNTEYKHLWTPKKYDTISNKGKKNTITSDSDTDSSYPSSKYNGKRLQRNDWVGPDIKLNLKDLGLNKQLGSWIEFVQQKPVMSTIPVSFHILNIFQYFNILCKMFKFKVIVFSLFLDIIFRL